jgi:outer membrane protein assembly factor BamB
LIDGDKLICTPGGADATILAVNKMTGKVIWKSAQETADLAGYGSPVAATLSGVRQYVVFLGKGVVGVGAETGNPLWRYEKTANGSPANILTPVIQGNYVYTGSNQGGGGLIEIKLDREPIVKEIYHSQKMPIHVGGAVLVDGQMYGTTRSAFLSVAYETGEITWTDRSVGPATVGYADGRLYLVGDKGEIALVEPSKEGYKEISRFTPPGRLKGSVSWTYPVVANGRMYIRNLDKMWCYDVSAPKGL